MYMTTVLIIIIFGRYLIKLIILIFVFLDLEIIQILLMIILTLLFYV